MGRKEVLVWMVAASTVNYIGRSTMSIAGPELSRQFRFSEAELGQIFSAFWLGYAIMMWPSGWLSDRFPAARVLGICGILSAFLLAGTAWSSTLTAFLVLRFLFGLASAALYPACGSLTSQWFPPASFGGVQGIVVGGSNFGGALAPVLVTYLIHMGGWAGSFQWVGMLTLLFFLLWTWRLRQSAAMTKVEQRPSLRMRLPLLILAAQSFCIGYYYNFVDTWSYYYFKEVRHFTEEQSVLFTTLLQVAGGVMMPLGGWLSDLAAPRFGRRMPAFLGLILAGMLTALSAVVQEPSAVLGLTTAAYSLVVAAEGVYWWSILANAKENPGSAYGFANAVGNVAQFLAPLTLPWIAAHSNWSNAVHTVALSLAISALLWNWAIRLTPQQAD